MSIRLDYFTLGKIRRISNRRVKLFRCRLDYFTLGKIRRISNRRVKLFRCQLDYFTLGKGTVLFKWILKYFKPKILKYGIF